MHPSLGTPSLGLEAKFRLGLDLGLAFRMLLREIVVQPSTHVCVAHYCRRTNKFS